MFHGIWQLSKLSLTTEARRIGTHVIRLGLAAVLYLALVQGRWDLWATAPGRNLFRAQLLITTFFISMAAIFGFSQALAEEKEEDVLGLLRLAEISPLAILLAKLSVMLFDAGMLILIQIPFTVVAITLGGVSWDQVIAAYVSLTSYLWLMIALGIFISVVQPTGSTAVRMTTIVVLAYSLPLLLRILPFPFTWIPVRLINVCLPIRMVNLTESAFSGAAIDTSVLFGFSSGLILLVCASWMFDRFAMSATAGQKSVVSPVKAQMQSHHATRHRAEKHRVSNRSWDRPLIWREFRFANRGMVGIQRRLLVQLLIVLFFAFYFSANPQSIGITLAWSSLLSGFIGLLDGTWTVSRLFRDEIRDQTWSTLVQTPHTIWELARDKTYGWGLSLLPSILTPYLFITSMLFLHEHVPNDFFIRLELIVGSLAVGAAIFSYLHLLALLTLYIGQKAIPLTISSCIAAGWLYVVTIFNSQWNTPARCVIFLITPVALFGLIVIFQRLILRRLAVLAATA